LRGESEDGGRRRLSRGRITVGFQKILRKEKLQCEWGRLP